MNIFGQLYAIMFAVGILLFLSNPMGFLEESERVLRASGPKIIDGRFGIPKRKAPVKTLSPIHYEDTLR
jgi:hypothetical protein